MSDSVGVPPWSLPRISTSICTIPSTRGDLLDAYNIGRPPVYFLDSHVDTSKLIDADFDTAREILSYLPQLAYRHKAKLITACRPLTRSKGSTLSPSRYFQPITGSACPHWVLRCFRGSLGGTKKYRTWRDVANCKQWRVDSALFVRIRGRKITLAAQRKQFLLHSYQINEPDQEKTFVYAVSTITNNHGQNISMNYSDKPFRHSLNNLGNATHSLWVARVLMTGDGICHDRPIAGTKARPLCGALESLGTQAIGAQSLYFKEEIFEVCTGPRWCSGYIVHVVRIPKMSLSDFHKDLWFPLYLHSGAASFPARFTLIASQEPVVETRPNLSTELERLKRLPKLAMEDTHNTRRESSNLFVSGGPSTAATFVSSPRGSLQAIVCGSRPTRRRSKPTRAPIVLKSGLSVVFGHMNDERPHTGKSIGDARRDFARRLHKEGPPKRTILRWEHKLFLKGSIKGKQKTGHLCGGGAICALITQELEHDHLPVDTEHQITHELEQRHLRFLEFARKCTKVGGQRSAFVRVQFDNTLHMSYFLQGITPTSRGAVGWCAAGLECERFWVRILGNAWWGRNSPVARAIPIGTTVAQWIEIYQVGTHSPVARAIPSRAIMDQWIEIYQVGPQRLSG
ncbi:hypothetical protein PR048_014862 [Dryococelus australis]|uniref:Uncharacterized protein n=1 Tax=Dryococelus australis TaxID=614101 RepID=A0ABQ9HFD2_9NEOP|nr:hypothetical protein PR048_014862 [Dryococelus australis]